MSVLHNVLSQMKPSRPSLVNFLMGFQVTDEFVENEGSKYWIFLKYN